jgi:hypothetical protein
MQIPFVMMVALAGLGCDNHTSVVVDTSPLAGYRVQSPLSGNDHGGTFSTSAGTFAPTSYPEIPTRFYTSYSEPPSPDWHSGLRSTLCSFVIGRDPDVNTVREIEASVYGVDSDR